MLINLKNLGPVKEASIDLSKKFTVFCGENNTGKTYVAYAIYGIIKILKSLPLVEEISFKLDRKALEENKAITLQLDAEKLHPFYDKISEILKQSINNIYGISHSDVKKLMADVEITFGDEKQFAKKILDSKFIYSEWGFQFTKKQNSNEIEVRTNGVEGHMSIRNDIVHISTFPVYNFLTYPLSNTHIFPVERNSIYTFSKELSIKRNKLIDEIQKIDSPNIDPFEWTNRRTTRYPKPIRDGLEIAEDLANYQKTKTEFYEFAEEIEQKILNGKVSVTKDGEVQFASNKAKTKKLPIHLSASLVKTLSSLIFYLKHLAKPNDLIIIDEPELNLHPNNQILITRFFAKLMNKGFRILMSTHSDYIIREINNLIMLGNINEPEKMKDWGYEKDEWIKDSDIGAYLFKYPKSNSTKTVVKPLKIEADGFDVDTIDQTINNLEETSMTLYQYLYNKQESNVNLY